jgi:hypothetical protein
MIRSGQVLGPYMPYLIRRWREIQALDYTHSARTVCRIITQLQRAPCRAATGGRHSHEPLLVPPRNDSPEPRSPPQV